MARKQPTPNIPIGERLRLRRIESLAKSVRDMARLLDTSPIHISDIETGKRTPSDELLVRMAQAYGIPEAELRSGFARAPSEVNELATETPIAVEKVPEFLRSARGMTAEQWDKFIKEAKRITERKGDKP